MCCVLILIVCKFCSKYTRTQHFLFTYSFLVNMVKSQLFIVDVFSSGCRSVWQWICCLSCSLCSSIAAVPPLLHPLRCRSAPQTWSRLSQPPTPPPTSNGFTRHPYAPWKLLNQHPAGTPPPLCPHAAARKWPRTTLSPPALTYSWGPCAATAGGRCPSRSARRAWKDSCRRRRASSLPGLWETEVGCRSCLRSSLRGRFMCCREHQGLIWGQIWVIIQAPRGFHRAWRH